MANLRSWLQGKKTYIVAALTVVAGVAQAFGVPLHPVIYPILGALGLGSLRAGVNKTADSISEAVEGAK